MYPKTFLPFNLPQIPQNYQQITTNYQQIPQNFQQIPQNFQQLPQNYQQISTQKTFNQKEKYNWNPRTEIMKWNLAESIDVEQIVRKGDIQSIEFYISQFVNSNITKDDLKYFGSKGALNAFLILQLGVDYLLNQRNNLNSTNIEPDPIFLEQYNNNIKIASESINSHKLIIEKLKEQNKKLHDDRNKQMKIIEKYRYKFNLLKKKLLIKKKKKSKNLNDTEPGMIHDNTEFKKLIKNEKKIKKKLIKEEDSNSEGEIHSSNDEIFNNYEEDEEEEIEYVYGYSEGEI